MVLLMIPCILKNISRIHVILSSRFWQTNTEMSFLLASATVPFSVVTLSLIHILKELLFEENENINITKYTQIAMLADELAIWSVLREKGVESAVNAGLSLGEYAALVASGVMTPEDAFRVVTKRGEFMQEAVPTLSLIHI